MTPEDRPSTNPAEPISPELDRHLSDPAQKTEEISGEQDRAAKPDPSPTEPGATSENQPT